ncbi:hypothetical protein ILUMI_02135 [Ignelater luminosus]|uniref:CHK kinase-like domain-containing protein n=1 Tax=Ignelater luminosus TaxID=2038154 RepID=A0A8K0DIV4_IGNLU|nr:hypothetical protein ILUMI_02135 [Ignelater luminosus]
MSDETTTKNLDLVTDEVQTHVEKLINELGITNYTINVVPGSVIGDNYLGVIAKVTVTGKDKNGENKVTNFIVKSAPQNEVYRTLTSIRSAFDREIYMYSKVFPEFIKFQEERRILNPFKSIAKFYKSTMENKNEAVIMEDMKELGFEMRDRREPLNYNHVLLVMREYGKYHALSYALRDQKPEVFQEILGNTQETFFNTYNQAEIAEKEAKENYERALKSLDPVKDKIAYDKFKKFQDNMFETVKHVLQSESAGKYAVIGHGDSWVNNMLFKYDSTSKPHSPSEICLLDWQLARAGSPALDLAYFIFACTDKPLRDQYYDHLIQEYHKSLSSFLRELGSDPDKLFPFEVLQEHLKKFSVFGLYMSMTILYAINSEVEEIPDFHNMANLDELVEGLKFESKNIERYNARMRGAILDFIKFGYEL